jgi:hypothetical protein
MKCYSIKYVFKWNILYPKFLKLSLKSHFKGIIYIKLWLYLFYQINYKFTLN